MANTQIDIRTNGKTTLATVGKFCDRNIDVNVSVPESGITPSGTMDIVENGIYDVTEFASALVDVPIPSKNMVVLPITISTDMGAGTNTNRAIVTGNSFIQQHYADDSFVGILIPLSVENFDVASGVVSFIYQGNRALIKTNNTFYGAFVKSNGPSSTPNVQANNYKISANGYNVSLRAASTGNVNLYVASSYTVRAGSYLLALGLMG